MEIAVMSKKDAACRWSEFDAVITIEGVSEEDGFRVLIGDGIPQLVLRFDDVIVDSSHQKAATRQQIQRALDWAREWRDGKLLVHCEMGVSRSAAIATAIIADYLGEGAEDQAVARLLSIRPVAACNPLIIAQADGILSRQGALVRAVEHSDRRRFASGFFLPTA